MKWDKFDWMMAVIIGCIMAIGVALMFYSVSLLQRAVCV